MDQMPTVNPFVFLITTATVLVVWGAAWEIGKAMGRKISGMANKLTASGKAGG